MRTLCRSETSNSGMPALAPLPTLTNAPTSVLRWVTTPSNGATMFLKFSSAWELAHIRPGAVGDRLVGRGRAGLLVIGLLRHPLRTDEGLPALRRDDRHLLVGLGGRQIGFRLLELLIEIRRVDHTEELASLHMGADVLLPALEIAGDPGVDRRLEIGLDRAGKRKAFLHRSAFDLGELHGGDGGFVGPLHQLGGRRRPGFRCRAPRSRKRWRSSGAGRTKRK